MRKWNQFVLGLLLAAPVFGQTNSPAAVPAAPILQGAALPMYPPIARAAHITGKVIVQATVKSGRVVKTEVLSKADVAAGQRYLESPTVENLKTWRFAADVTGTFTVNYTYEISGTQIEEPTNAQVEMLPSLDVKITARPVKPTCSDCRSDSVPGSSPGAGVSHEAGHAQGSPKP
jgi:hypothetical protein